ncbi:tRNA lysidine(34) synthetase TilS [Undibacterium sp. Ren11W]|uniref:tRNA lysidine(34) synthetase TilS n=1 Tax=Undibacterium sp. Ren11W TaxID=3413045 RepID=UPI003BF07FB6
MKSVNQRDMALKQRFEEAISSIISEQAPEVVQRGIAIAYSGGLDSAVLLSLAADFCREKNIPIFAFHVHHGLSENADEWLAHCENACEKIDVGFSFAKVHINLNSKDGIEATARAERYRALGALCKQFNTAMLLTAHHQDDQAETLLLQLLRGSGVSGLSGMDLFNFAPALLSNKELLIARPLLGSSKEMLLDFANLNSINYVVDESNFDCRYARNALRQQVMPVLSKISQGYTTRLARSARHVQTAGRLLIELAQIDMAACLIDDALQIEKMRMLSIDRIENLLRYWFSTLGVRMPSTARLTEMRHQLFDARYDAKITIQHDKLGVHRYNDKIYACTLPIIDDELLAAKEFVWNGEAAIYFSDFSGSLHFESASYGVDKDWLMRQKLTLRAREGGERLRLAANRPTRDIKSHFQTLKIPFWQRQRLPFLYVNDKLLHAASVGTHSELCQIDSANLINFRWQAD